MTLSLAARIRARTARVAVVGLGYVGLPTAVRFAEAGYRVTGVDRRSTVRRAIGRGRSPLPDAVDHAAVRRVVRARRLRPASDASAATRTADVVLIIVGTPLGPHHRPDMSQVLSAGRAIARGLRPNQLIVLESTVHPGATMELLRPVLERSGLRAGADFGLAHCPERIVPGDPTHDVSRVDRVVGGITPAWTELARRLYQSVSRGRIHAVADITTAEAIKCLENTQRDLNIALANEMALLCERLGLDAWDVIDGAATKWNFLKVYPGAGVGGHCLPVDPWYLYARGRAAGYASHLIPAARGVNDRMPLHVADLLQAALREAGRALRGARVAVLGLAYKENLGDHRESPTMVLLARLRSAGARVVLVDPHVPRAAASRLGVPFQTDARRAARGADALVLMTGHREFRRLRLLRLRRVMRTPVLIDGRRAFDPARARRAGFVFRALGRGNAPSG